MSTSRRYYALSDNFLGDYPKNWTIDSIDMPGVIFFESDKARKAWLEETKLGTARVLSRSEAIQYSRELDNGDRVVRPVRRPGEGFGSDYVICKSQSRQ